MNAQSSLLPRLGIDFGKVIINPVDDGPQDTSFLQGSLDDALSTPPADDAFEIITQLVELFEGRVWIVSKAGQRIQQRTRQWLHHHRFYALTGIPKTHLRFCFKRHQKASHCRELGLTHFIDDRHEVLLHLKDIVPQLYIFGQQNRPSRDPSYIHVKNWQEVAQQLLPQFSRV